MNSHEGGDAAQRLRCTHLSFDYARGKYPERVQEDHTISQRVPLRSGGAGGFPASGGEGRPGRTFSTPRLPTSDFVQECQRPALLCLQTRFSHVVAIEEAKLAAFIAEDDGGVDVRGATDGARIAEARGHGADRADDVRLHRGLALEGAALAQVACREHRAPPGAEVLGGE